jgi:hypothetical protein
MTRPTDKNRRNLYIKQEDYDYLAQIGNGYADGLRKAVEAHKVLNAGKPATNNQSAVKGGDNNNE